MPLENETYFLPLQDYHDHIAEISAKLVAIMDSLFDKLLSKVMIYGNNYTLSKLQLESHCIQSRCFKWSLKLS